jgi:periplasmic protein TonB
MEYANFTDKPQFSAVGFGGSLILTGGMVVLLAFLSPDFMRTVRDDYTRVDTIAPTPPPKPVEPPKVADPVPPKVTLVEPRFGPAPPLSPHLVPPVTPPIERPVIGGVTPEPLKYIPPPTPEPTLEPKFTPPPAVRIGVRPDARYASALQPNYPMSMRRAGIEGRVIVRVLVGSDGRVKQVEEVQSADPAFYETTRGHALKRWRFKPATVDGNAVEAWYQVSLLFQLDE